MEAPKSLSLKLEEEEEEYREDRGGLKRKEVSHQRDRDKQRHSSDVEHCGVK